MAASVKCRTAGAVCSFLASLSRSVLASRRAASAVEYGVVLAAIGAVTLATIQGLGGTTRDRVSDASIEDAMDGDAGDGDHDGDSPGEDGSDSDSGGSSSDFDFGGSGGSGDSGGSGNSGSSGGSDSGGDTTGGGGSDDRGIGTVGSGGDRDGELDEDDSAGATDGESETAADGRYEIGVVDDTSAITKKVSKANGDITIWEAAVTFENNYEHDDRLRLEVTRSFDDGSTKVVQVNVKVPAGSTKTYVYGGNRVDERPGKQSATSVTITVLSIRTKDENGKTETNPTDGPTLVIAAPVTA